jgi:hypothetical protein
MKKIQAVMICLSIFLLGPGLVVPARGERAIGKVNVGLVASLHPRMSLFDFQTLGFFRVPLGLSAEQFKAAVESARGQGDTKSLLKRLQALDDQLIHLTGRKQAVFQEGQTPDQARLELAGLDSEAARLREERIEIEFSLRFPHLTPPAETRAILDEIEAEVMALVKAVAEERRVAVVLNTTLPLPFEGRRRYFEGNQYGQGFPGLNHRLFYSILANGEDPDFPKSMDERMNQWLHWTGHPEVQNVLPVKPWPLVLAGGEDLTSEIIRRLYQAHKIPDEVFATLNRVLASCEAGLPTAKPGSN